MRIPSMISTSPPTDDSPVATLPQIRPLHIGPLVVDPPVLQAPMAGFTNFAFRQVVREFGGVGLQATEMVCARAFCPGNAPKRNCPTGCGESPTSRGRWPCRFGITIPRRWPPSGAKLAHEFEVSVVDINFGCPVQATSPSGP